MAGLYKRFQDIPKFTPAGSYVVDHAWSYLEGTIKGYVENYDFDMGESDFQRGHVWTPEQQVAYVEYVLRGGRSGLDLYLNCTNWSGRGGEMGRLELVDGKQRLTAALKFLRNEIPAFGRYYKDYEGKLDLGVRFRFHVNDLSTRAQVLRWYLEMNTGGTVHTDEEIQKVKELLAEEVSKAPAQAKR